MKPSLIIVGLLLAVSASAARADDYYVVRDATTKHCTVVTQKPEAKEVVTQIGPLAFKSREEADDRIKKTKVCSDD